MRLTASVMLTAAMCLLSVTANAQVPLNIVSGSLTLEDVSDPTPFDFDALDLRGTVLLDTGAGQALVTDAFAGSSFGNVNMSGINPVFDGTSALLTFGSPAVSNPSPFSVSLNSTGIQVAGPLSPAEQVLEDNIQWTFMFTSAAPLGDGVHNLFTFALTSVVDETVTGTTPEPATWLYLLTTATVIAGAAAAKRLRPARD